MNNITRADAENQRISPIISLQYLHKDKAVQERQQKPKIIHNGGYNYGKIQTLDGMFRKRNNRLQFSS